MRRKRFIKNPNDAMLVLKHDNGCFNGPRSSEYLDCTWHLEKGTGVEWTCEGDEWLRKEC